MRCNKITADGLINAIEFDSSARMNFLSDLEETALNLPRNAYWQPFGEPQVIMLPRKVRQF